MSQNDVVGYNSNDFELYEDNAKCPQLTNHIKNGSVVRIFIFVDTLFAATHLHDLRQLKGETGSYNPSKAVCDVSRM